MQAIEIDRSKRLHEEPDKGHNRWHPDLTPVLEVDPGEEVLLETRDAVDGQLGPDDGSDALAGFDRGAVHPLTGPVYVRGAEPGDLLEIEFVDIRPQPRAYTMVQPGAGFIGDQVDEPLLVHWEIDGAFARSAQIPGFRLPGAPFMGVSGVAPSREELERWSQSEADYAAGGGRAFLPEAAGASPSGGLVASEGLRTMPPRGNGGNFDVKQLTKGSTLMLPVSVEGALYSTGDAHFTQGDGEVCLTAAEMGATVVVRFALRKGEAAKVRRTIRFRQGDYFEDPVSAVPRRFIATMGMPITDEGVNDGENLNLAARNALIGMLEIIQERGYSKEQAYAICSVAADLRISQAVDIPNYVVSAFLSEDLFEDGD